MRSRPDITLYLSPHQPIAGQELVARVRLDVKSETPCDGVVVTLLGRERRYRNTTSTGKTTVQHYHRRDVVVAGLMITPGTLRPGVLEQEFRFALPADAPPTFKSSLSRIEYRVEVRVDIPWWPDAHEVYDVTVHAPPVPGLTGHARSVTNVQGERRGEELAMELSVAEDVAQPGASLRGALALTGVAGRTLRRVEVACFAVESARVYSAAGPTEVDRRVWTIHHGTPAEGEALRFELGLPSELPVSFDSPFISLRHYLQATAVVAWGRDVSVHLPLQIAVGAGRAGAEVPVVGRARNLAVWQLAVSEVTIPGASVVRFEPEAARVVFSVRGLRVVAREESRGELPCLVAEVMCDPMGLELRVAERRWTDLGAKISGLDDAFQSRFTARAREPAQALAVLDAALMRALAAFEEAALDDRGAVVSQSGGVFQLVGLQRFLRDVQLLAASLAAARDRAPPPAALASSVGDYERFARARGATLRRGDLTLDAWSVRGVILRTAHRWSGAELSASALEFELPEGADSARWSAALREAFGGRAALRGRVASVEMDALRDPARAVPDAEALAGVALGLMGGEGDGPYRQ